MKNIKNNLGNESYDEDSGETGFGVFYSTFTANATFNNIAKTYGVPTWEHYGSLNQLGNSGYGQCEEE